MRTLKYLNLLATVARLNRIPGGQLPVTVVLRGWP